MSDRWRSISPILLLTTGMRCRSLLPFSLTDCKLKSWLFEIYICLLSKSTQCIPPHLLLFLSSLFHHHLEMNFCHFHLRGFWMISTSLQLHGCDSISTLVLKYHHTKPASPVSVLFSVIKFRPTLIGRWPTTPSSKKMGVGTFTQ